MKWLISQLRQLIIWTAKAAHNLDFSTWLRKSREVNIKELKEHMMLVWETEWRNEMYIHDKGHHIAEVRGKIGSWPWAAHKWRRIESAMARLRIGHVGLNQHLFRFNMAATDLCLCGETETVYHFMLECPIYEQLRAELHYRLSLDNVPCNLKNLLGGGSFDCAIQERILEVVSLYLQGTGRLGQL